jgi:hypothetical protein
LQKNFGVFLSRLRFCRLCQEYTGSSDGKLSTIY